MPETFQEQRTRVLRENPEASPSQYDLAVLFGYAPESWDGMWKLRAGYPITQLTKNWAICAEVRGVTKRGRQKIRYVLRRATDT